MATIIKTYLFTGCRKRAPYIAYLTRCRQGLQTSQAHLERLLQRVLRDKEVANRYFTTVCVRILLEHMEAKMLDFIKGNSVLHPDQQVSSRAASVGLSRESWTFSQDFSHRCSTTLSFSSFKVMFRSMILTCGKM